LYVQTLSFFFVIIIIMQQQETKKKQPLFIPGTTRSFLANILNGLQFTNEVIKEEDLIEIIYNLNLPNVPQIWSNDQYKLFCSSLKNLIKIKQQPPEQTLQQSHTPINQLPQTEPQIKDEPSPIQLPEEDKITSLNQNNTLSTSKNLKSSELPKSHIIQDDELIPQTNELLENKKSSIQQNVNLNIKQSPQLKNIKREVKKTLIIDSLDRVKHNLNSSINPFVIKFKNHGNQYQNIKSIQLIEAVVPKKTFHGNNISKYPYILLQIKEIGSTFEASNKFLSKAFAKLDTEPYKKRFLKHRMYNDTLNKKIFNEPISISKLTFKLLTPQGEVIKIGSFFEKEGKNDISETLVPVYCRESRKDIKKKVSNHLLSKNNKNEIKKKTNTSKKKEPQVTFTFEIITIEE